MPPKKKKDAVPEPEPEPVEERPPQLPLGVTIESTKSLLLLLSSTEDAVVNNALDALLYFIKNDDSDPRGELLSVGAPDSLVLTFENPDPAIQEKLVEIYHLCTEDAEFRGLIRTTGALEKIIEMMCSYFSYPDTMQEKILGTVAQCSFDNESRAPVRIKGGVETLLTLCSASESVELLKKATLTLANCCAEPESQQVVTAQEAWTPLLTLCGEAWSHVPEIQGNAALILARCAEQPENVMHILEAGGIRTLINLLRNKQSGVRNKAVLALANLSHILETRAPIRSNGAIKLVLGLLQEESQLSVQSIMATLLANLVVDDTETRREIKAHDGIRTLAEILFGVNMNPDIGKPQYNDMIEKVALTMGTLATEESCRKQIFADGGVDAMIGVMKTDDLMDACIVGAYCASGITAMAESRESRLEVLNLQGLAPIAKATRSRFPLTRINAALALSNLAYASEVRDAFFELGAEVREDGTKTGLGNALRPLVVMLSGEADEQEAASMALANFNTDKRHRDVCFKLGCVKPMVKILEKSESLEAKKNTVHFMTVMCRDVEICEEASTNNAVTVLDNLSKSGARHLNQMARQCLERLMVTYPAARFWLKGQCGYTDYTGDGMYDTGRGAPVAGIWTFLGMKNLRKLPIMSVTDAFECDARRDKQLQGWVEELRALIDERNAAATRRNLEGVGEESAEAENDGEGREPSPDYGDETIEDSVERDRDIAKTLAVFVSDHLGGPVADEDYAKFTVADHVSRTKREMRSNVVPIGKLELGNTRHRALLFKYFCDIFAIPCTLEKGKISRGHYSGHAWNTVKFADGSEWLVDVMHLPGEFLVPNSEEAKAYQREGGHVFSALSTDVRSNTAMSSRTGASSRAGMSSRPSSASASMSRPGSAYTRPSSARSVNPAHGNVKMPGTLRPGSARLAGARRTIDSDSHMFSHTLFKDTSSTPLPIAPLLNSARSARGQY